MAEKGETEKENISNFGKLIYDSHPNNENLAYIFCGILGIVVIIIIIGQQLNFIENICYVIFGMALAFSDFILLLYWSENNSNRIKIFEKGIILMGTVRSHGNPFKNIATGWASGKRSVKYEDIVAIYYINPWSKDNKTLKIGLQIILPKEGNKYIVGYIGLAGKKRKKISEIIHFLKRQMKDDWEEKFKKKSLSLFR